VHARQPRDEVPVGLRALLEELEDHARRGDLRRQARLAGDLAHHVGGRHLLEGPHLAHALQLVALVERADDDGRALLAELGLLRDDLALEDRLRRGARGRRGLDLDGGPDLELAEQGVDLAAVRVREAHAGGVGQHEGVAHPDLGEQVLERLVERGPGDEDVDARDVLLGLGCPTDRHQSSSLGRLSGRPRRRWSGFSIPLASAITRQSVASP
jgi:hypothetical protein